MAAKMRAMSGGRILLLAGSAWLAAGQVAGYRHMTADFHLVPLRDAAVVSAVKLVESNGVAMLYATDAGPLGSDLSLARFPGDAPRIEPLGALSALPERPAWDAMAEGGAFSVVITEAGSAVSGLAIRNTGSGTLGKVNRRDGFGVFGAPHFVKGDPGPISSVALLDGKTPVVVFPREADGGFGKYRQVEAAVEGVAQDARLIRSGKGYSLFVKVMSIGAAAAARRLASGKVIYAGVLVYVPLDEGFRATELPSRPLGGQLIIDFDVCAFHDGVAVFAATPKGYVLAAGKLSNGVYATGTWVEELHKRPLSSPSVLATGGQLHLAAIESMGAPDAQVVMAQVP